LEPFKNERASWEILLKAIYESEGGLSYEKLRELVNEKDLDRSISLLKREHLILISKEKKYIINPREKDSLPLR